MHLPRLASLVGLLLLAAIIPGLIRTKAASPNTPFEPEAALQPPSPPVAVNDFYTVHGGRLLTPLDNDSAPGESMHIESFTQPAHGSVSPYSVGAVVYNASYAYTGSDSFTYTVCDSASACATATVNIDVVN